MNQSVWLKKHVEEVQGKRDKENKSKKIILILVPLMMLLFIVPALLGSDGMDEQMKMGVIAMIGTMVGVMLLIILLIGKAKKIDATVGTRENVMAILKNAEDVMRFDVEMSNPPLREITFTGTSKFFVTQSFVGVSFMMKGDLQYRFAKKDDIAGIDYCMSKALPGYVDIFFDILDAKGQKIFGSVASNASKMEEVVRTMKDFNTDLIVRVK